MKPINAGESIRVNVDFGKKYEGSTCEYIQEATISIAVGSKTSKTIATGIQGWLSPVVYMVTENGRAGKLTKASQSTKFTSLTLTTLDSATY